MSRTAIARVLAIPGGLVATPERLVLLVLATHVNQDRLDAGEPLLVWPNRRTLAAECGWSDRNVHDRLSALEDAGWISTWRRGGGTPRPVFGTDHTTSSTVRDLKLPTVDFWSEWQARHGQDLQVLFALRGLEPTRHALVEARRSQNLGQSPADVVPLALLGQDSPALLGQDSPADHVPTNRREPESEPESLATKQGTRYA